MKKAVLVLILSVLLIFTSCSIDINSQPTTLDSVQAEFHFLSVGQGDSTIVILGDYVTLVDAGLDSSYSHIDKYLKDLNIKEIDLMVITHPHDDHMGSADEILSNYRVKNIIDSGYYHPNKNYEAYEKAIAKEILLGAKYSEDKDITINLNDKMKIEIIENGDDWEDVNNQSVIVRFTCDEISLLITGDLEKEGEKNLLGLNKELNSTIFTAGHHGSATSNSVDFIDAVRPEVVVISTGLNNKYNLPNKDVVTMFNEKGIEIYETAYYGDIVYKTDGKKIKLEENQNNLIEILKLDKVNEYVTIVNKGDTDIDLSNYYLISYRGNQRYDFPKGYVLKAKCKVTIWSGKNAFTDGIENLKWTTKNIWSNDKSDPAYLYTGNEEMISMGN